MKPFIHARNSVRRYGGVESDYIEIHNFFDSTKSAWADVRHRAVLHSTFGIFLVEQLFGVTLTNSDGKVISVRDVAEDHVIEDCGFIPTIEKWLHNIPMESWMRGHMQSSNVARTRVPLDVIEEAKHELID